MTSLDLLVIGDINPDIVVSGADVEPRFDQVEKLVESADLVVGGSAAITALGAARLGAEVGICGVVGDDTLGHFMIERLEDGGVDTAAVRIDPETPTGISIILVSGRDRAILTAPGTIPKVGADDLAGLDDCPARHVHASSYYLMGEEFRDALPIAMARFRGGAATTSLDSNWDPSENWDMGNVLQTLDFYFPNRSELSAIAGTGIVEEALDIVSRLGPAVVAKLGPDGAVAKSVDEGPISIPAPDPGPYVDAVGAGDNFNAGFLTSRLSGGSISEALRLGVTVGSLSTTKQGGTEGQPTMEEAKRLMTGVTQ